MAPKVFLSSTIRDLADLRSAVRYYLEEHGFEVYASESANFPHGLDHDARVAALAPLDDADVYVLLLGFRYGSQTSDGVSATRLEFRRARDLHRHGGRPKSVLLVRRDVLRLIKAGVESSDESDDWAALRSFVAEVGNEGEDASPNWINEFSSFRDVASVLSATLRLTGSLRRLALELTDAGDRGDHAVRTERPSWSRPPGSRSPCPFMMPIRTTRGLRASCWPAISATARTSPRSSPSAATAPRGPRLARASRGSIEAPLPGTVGLAPLPPLERRAGRPAPTPPGLLPRRRAARLGCTWLTNTCLTQVPRPLFSRRW